jgi:outer membrane protein TolC
MEAPSRVACRGRPAIPILFTGLLVLTGCAAVDVREQLPAVEALSAPLTDGLLQTSRDLPPEDRDGQAAVLLAEPVDDEAALRLSLLNDPDFARLLADYEASLAGAEQSGRLRNPVFAIERLVSGGEVELARSVALGLLDLILLPQRRRLAGARTTTVNVSLAGQVVARLTDVKRAWVVAVAARQSLEYAQQVADSAAAAAELAERMREAGNLNRRDEARQQSFSAQAAVMLQRSQADAVATRERLVRLLGLTPAQAETLRLPGQLPLPPSVPQTPATVASASSSSRIDIRLAEAVFREQAAARNLQLPTTLIDVEAVARADRLRDRESGAEDDRRGFEFSLVLPLLDPGDAERLRLDASLRASLAGLEGTVRRASSSLREQFALYQAAWLSAREFTERVVPLQQRVLEESLLRYNGMLIGVFELLIDARLQIEAVRDGIAAVREFWLADADLTAEMLGVSPGIDASRATPFAAGGASVPGLHP